MPLGLGVIGCGWAAGEIARVVDNMRNLRIVAVTDADAARARAYAQRTGGRHAHRIDDMLADPAVGAIYVGTPHYLLAAVVERALHAGKHVLCEKPLALSAEDALRLGDLANAHGLKLAVFFELRRSGPVELARRLVSDGVIGGPRLVRIRTVIDKPLSYWGPKDAPIWRASKREAGGGVLLMNTIHQLDALRYVTGLDYVRASGEIDTFSAPADVEDAASATLRMSNGALVSIVATAHSPGASGDETIEIDGELGRLDLPYPFGSDPVRLCLSSTKLWRNYPVERPDCHAAMVESFVDSARHGGPEPANAKDAAAVLAAVSAIYQSARDGRAIDIA